jgi:uncharacterized protein (TIGR02722 family)
MAIARNIAVGAVIFWALVLSACSSAPQVDRRNAAETIDLSGRWNDADSRMVSETMIADCLDRPWLEAHRDASAGHAPTIIVGRVRNRSHEHINVQTFIKDLERAMINSGQVQFVASAEERIDIRDERIDMAANASEETMKGPGREIGADYMLIGSIQSIRDEIPGRALMYYQVNLELIALESNRKVWIGQKEIKKLIERPEVRW